LLAFLQLVLELEDWGGLTPADDLGCSLLDEEADLCRADDLDPVSLNYALSNWVVHLTRFQANNILNIINQIL
jgi:hypothetical protein